MINTSFKKTLFYLILTIIMCSSLAIITSAAYYTANTNAVFSRNISQSIGYGYQITMNQDGLLLYNVTKSSWSNATMAYLYTGGTGDKMPIANASFTGDTATFTANITLNKSQNYTILTTIPSSTMLVADSNSTPNPAYPQTTTYCNFTARIYTSGLVPLNGSANMNRDTYNTAQILSVGFWDGNVTSEIIFVNQSPSNLTSTNGFPVTIIYNFTNTTMTYNYINYTIATNNNRCVVITNGSCTQNSNTYAQMINTTPFFSTTLQSYELSDNQVYPADYNINETIMRTTNHSSLTSNSINDVWTINFINVSNTTNYNIFEVMANSTDPRAVLYCNSSYTSGNPLTNSNCIQFATLNTTSFNHSHSVYEYHNVFSLPINITTGRLGTVQVTPNSSIKIKGTNVGSMQISYINNFSRVMAAQTSNNLGVINTNQSYTFDSHLHQYIGDERLNYTACKNVSGTITCDSTIRSDIIDEEYLPPTAPQITSPTAYQNVTKDLNITWTASVPSSNSSSISNYTVLLLNNDLSTNQTLAITTNLYYYWNTFNSNLTISQYYIGVLATDTNGNTALGISDPFNITRNAELNITASDIITNATITNFTIVLTDIVSATNESNTSANNRTTFYIIKDRNYTMDINAVGYALSQQNFTGFVYNELDTRRNNTERNTTGISWTLMNSFNVSNYTQATATIYSTNMKTSGVIGAPAYCYVKFFYTDSTDFTTPTQEEGTTTYQAHTFYNANPYKYLSAANLYCSNGGLTATAYMINDTMIINYYNPNGTTQAYYNTTVYLYKENSVNMFIYDDITNLLITDNVSITFTGTITGYSYSTVTGNYFAYDLEPDTYDVLFSVPSGAYSDRTYSILVQNRTTQTLNARLVNSSLSKAIGIYVRNNVNQPIDNVTLTVQQNVNGSMVTVTSGLTDILGYIRINVRENYPYQIIIDPPNNLGYDLLSFPFKFYESLSPYNFQLTGQANTTYTNILNEVSYNYTPTFTQIENGSIVSFVIATYSNPARLLWSSVTTPTGTTNVSGSPGGMIVNRTETINSSSSSYPVTYCFASDGYPDFCFTINYFVPRTGGYYYNLQDSMINLKNDFLSGDTASEGKGWLAILAVFITMVVAIQLNQIIGNPTISTMGALGTSILFAYWGWINPLIVGAIALITVITFFYFGRSGGSY